MNRYHVNPETGKTGICKAVNQCRFNLSENEHYETESDARKAYEESASQSFGTFETLKKNKLPKPEKFYHVTTQSNLDSIMSNGLIPSIGERSSRLGEENSSIYLFDSKQSVEDALGNWLGEEFDEDEQLVLLEVSSKDIDTVPSFEGDDSSFEWTTKNAITPSNIKVSIPNLDEVTSIVNYSGEDNNKEENIFLSSNMGEATVRNGDLNDPKSRLLLSTGLCGDLAMNIHEKTGWPVAFVIYNNFDEKELQEKFEKDPAVVLTAQHVMIETPHFDDEGNKLYLDSYGLKTLDEVNDFYEGITITRGTTEMVRAFAGENYKNLSKFADTAISFSEKGISFEYDEDALDYEDLEDEEDYYDDFDPEDLNLFK